MDIGINPVKEPESTMIIHFLDCDPFGHLNNARFIDYFMNARQEHIAEHYGIQIMEPNRSGSWVVSQTKIAFIAPAAMGEKVLIRSRIIGYSDRSLRVECEMLNEAERRLKALLWSDFTYVSLASGRPTPHPIDMMQLFQAVGMEVERGDSFEQRVDLLRGQYRRLAEAISAESKAAA